MRAQLFESTLEIHHRLLRSRDFDVNQRGIRVETYANWESSNEEYRTGDYHLTLVQNGMLWDSEFGSSTCEAGTPCRREWGNLPSGTYHLVIWTNNTNPHRYLSGDITVSESDDITAEGCTVPPPGPLEMAHDALQIAGLIPVLGVAADIADTGLYVFEGDWVGAGLSAVGLIPLFGDAATAARVGGRMTLRVSGEGLERVGRDELAAALSRERRRARPRSVIDADTSARVEHAFAEQAESTGEIYSGSQRLARGNFGERAAAETLAHDGYEIISYKPAIEGTNQGGIDIVALRGNRVALVDNKALTRTGNVSAVSALTTNYAANLATVRSEVVQALARPGISAEETAVLRRTLDGIDAGRVDRIVTNANIARDQQFTSGVTERLARQGLQFLDVVR